MTTNLSYNQKQEELKSYAKYIKEANDYIKDSINTNAMN
jgi:hypothetical protein